MPQAGDIWESYRANEFVVIIDGTESPGITKISGISEGEVETIEQPEGGSMIVHKIAGSKIKYDSLTIERHVDGSPEDQKFQEWFKAIFNLSSATQGGSSIRRNGLIEKRHNGEPVLAFAFYSAWIKSSKFTDLEAGSTTLFKQTIVLEHEGMERVS